jgi:hypothetical protein
MKDMITRDKLTHIEGETSRNGNCRLEWNLDYNRIYSPDGRHQLMPCDRCGQPQWVSRATCAVICELCADALQGGGR